MAYVGAFVASSHTGTSADSDWQQFQLAGTDTVRLLSSQVRAQQISLTFCGSWIFFFSELQTAATILTFILAMTIYPSIQPRAQKEVDRFLRENGKLPDFEDNDKMPFISAIIQQMLR